MTIKSIGILDLFKNTKSQKGPKIYNLDTIDKDNFKDKDLRTKKANLFMHDIFNDCLWKEHKTVYGDAKSICINNNQDDLYFFDNYEQIIEFRIVLLGFVLKAKQLDDEKSADEILNNYLMAEGYCFDDCNQAKVLLGTYFKQPFFNDFVIKALNNEFVFSDEEIQINKDNHLYRILNATINFLEKYNDINDVLKVFKKLNNIQINWTNLHNWQDASISYYDLENKNWFEKQLLLQRDVIDFNKVESTLELIRTEKVTPKSEFGFFKDSIQSQLFCKHNDLKEYLNDDEITFFNLFLNAKSLLNINQLTANHFIQHFNKIDLFGTNQLDYVSFISYLTKLKKKQTIKESWEYLFINGEYSLDVEGKSKWDSQFNYQGFEFIYTSLAIRMLLDYELIKDEKLFKKMIAIELFSEHFKTIEAFEMRNKSIIEFEEVGTFKPISDYINYEFELLSTIDRDLVIEENLFNMSPNIKTRILYLYEDWFKTEIPLEKLLIRQVMTPESKKYNKLKYGDKELIGNLDLFDTKIYVNGGKPLTDNIAKSDNFKPRDVINRTYKIMNFMLDKFFKN